MALDRISLSEKVYDHNFDICASVFTEIVFTQSLSAGNINVPMNLIKLLRYSLIGICLWLGIVRQSVVSCYIQDVWETYDLKKMVC